MKSIKKVIAAILLLTVTFSSVVPTGFEVRAAGSTESTSMYRLYNPNSGEHFYTADSNEKDYLVAVGWNDEGIGWNAPLSSDTPVYRLYNPNAGDHHYTMSAGERDYLISVGWNDENIGWYSDDAMSVPLYRQYNPNAMTGTHNYTISQEENNYLVSVGWNEEGIGWYGVSDSSSDGSEELVETEKSVETYSVSNLVIDKSAWKATVDVGAPGDCKLIVRFVDEDTYFADGYTSGKSYINNGKTIASYDVTAADEIKEVTASITGANALPEHFVTEAVLVDANGNNLCNPYTSIDNTARHEAFEAKDVDSFPEQNVLNFDDDNTTNFGVLNDEVKMITAATVVEEGNGEEDDEDSIITYTITSPSEDINIGDKVYLFDDDGEYLFKAAMKNTLSDGRIVVTAAKADDETLGYGIVDFFDYLDVEMGYDDTNEKNSPRSFHRKGTASKPITKRDLSVDTGTIWIKGSLSGMAYTSVDVEFAPAIFGDDYFKCDFVCKLSLDSEVSGGLKANNAPKYKNRLPLFPLKFEVIPLFFQVFLQLNFDAQIELSAGFTAEGNCEITEGFSYNTISGYNPIEEKNYTWKIDVRGKAEIKVGPVVTIGAEALEGALSIELETFVGYVVSVGIGETIPSDGISDHLCEVCLDGECRFQAKVSLKMKYSIFGFVKGTALDVPIFDDIDIPLFDFYVSLKNPETSLFHGEFKSGKGKCPNRSNIPYQGEYADYLSTQNLLYGQSIDRVLESRDESSASLREYNLYPEGTLGYAVLDVNNDGKDELIQLVLDGDGNINIYEKINDNGTIKNIGWAGQHIWLYKIGERGGCYTFKSGDDTYLLITHKGEACWYYEGKRIGLYCYKFENDKMTSVVRETEIYYDSSDLNLDKWTECVNTVLALQGKSISKSQCSELIFENNLNLEEHMDLNKFVGMEGDKTPAERIEAVNQAISDWELEGHFMPMWVSSPAQDAINKTTISSLLIKV